MDSIFSYSKPNRDYYEILGCTPSSNADQIQAEYKVKALLCHPDKHPDCEEKEVEFKLLQEAKNVLLDPAKRSAYNKWSSAGICMPFDQWLNLSQSGHAFHWTNSKAGRTMIADKDSAKEEIGTTSNEGLGWERDSSDALKKFRMYEI